MPLYIGDYMADTIDLSFAEHGAYILAIMAYWRKRGPLTHQELLAICDIHCSRVSKFFVTESVNGSDVWRHHRIDKEIESSNNRKMAQIARTSAARAALMSKKHSVTDNVTGSVTKSSSPSPSSSPVQTHTHTPLPPVEKCVCVSDQKRAFENNNRYKWLETELCAFYNRKTLTLPPGEEQCLVAEVARRPDVQSEFAELKKYRQEVGQKFFPQSIKALCSQWDCNLDKSRNHSPAPKQYHEKSILEKESDAFCARIMKE